MGPVAGYGVSVASVAVCFVYDDLRNIGGLFTSICFYIIVGNVFWNGFRTTLKLLTKKLYLKWNYYQFY